ncbi:MAG: CGGC domain-containing protein [Fimbriimonadaceae bacterium]|nr:CGGC domain-containing protein [Fimbriimonadaceae bacterium]
MSDQPDVRYLAVVQCDIVMERCSGYYCEQAFHHRSGGFAAYPADREYRTLYLTCGGCCGRALHRKLANLKHKAQANEGVAADQIVVQLASCITKESYHGPACPHLGYLRELIAKVGLQTCDDTHLSRPAIERRATGEYRA